MTGSISDRQIEALGDIAEGLRAIAAALRETPQPEDAQIAAPVPAERPDIGSGDSRTLGDRLRALRARFVRNAGEDDPNNDQDVEITGYTYWAVVQGLDGMADEADRARAAHKADVENLGRANVALVVQVEAIREAIEREAAHGDAITRCYLVAERFQAVLDGAKEAP